MLRIVGVGLCSTRHYKNYIYKNINNNYIFRAE